MAKSSKYERNEQKSEPKAPNLIAYHVAERGKDNSFWTRIGAAWEHEDGKGLTLNLELVPVNAGRIVLRVPSEKTEENGKGAQ